MNDKIDFKDMTQKDMQEMFFENNATMEELNSMTLQLLKANDDLREADASKRKFMSLIKNEFNNPMSVLLNLSKRLAQSENLKNPQEIGVIMHTELLRMDFQLRNIFAMTELESGLLSNNYSKITLNQLIEDAKEEFIYEIKEKNLKLNTEIDNDIHLVTDVDKLYLILINLISNACEFSKINSTILISLSKVENKIVLMVSNDGSELPKLDNMDDIFNTFSSYNENSIRSFSGLGIGLSVAKNMAEQIGSTIKYETIEQTTSFSVVLPQRELKNGEESFGSQEVFFDNFLGEDDDALEF